MGNYIYVDRVRYVAVADAAAASKLSSDYVARLCREQKITSTRVGKHWFVNEESLNTFIDAQRRKDEQRRDELATKRRLEYHQAARGGLSSLKPEASVATAIAARAAFVGSHEGTSGMPAYVIHPALDFLHKVAATVTAVSLVFGTYAFADRETAREVFAQLQERSSQLHVATSRQSLTAFATHARGTLTDAIQNPQSTIESSKVAMSAAAGVSVDGLARRWNAFIDGLIFGAMFDAAPVPRIVTE